MLSADELFDVMDSKLTQYINWSTAVRNTYCSLYGRNLVPKYFPKDGRPAFDDDDDDQTTTTTRRRRRPDDDENDFGRPAGFGK